MLLLNFLQVIADKKNVEMQHDMLKEEESYMVRLSFALHFCSLLTCTGSDAHAVLFSLV
jgi:hypothetical protein